MNRNRKKQNMIVILGIILLGITIGYAFLSSSLNISGTAELPSASWNIHWSNLVVTNGSVTGAKVTTPAAIKTGNTEVEYSITLSTPGDFYEFTVDAVNEGSIDAMIESFSNKAYEDDETTEKTIPDYLNYSVSYDDGIPIASNHKLDAGATEKVKVRVEFKRDIEASQLPTTTDTFMFKFNVTYVQADNNAIEKPVPDFQDSTWDGIVSKIKSGKIPSNWTAGSTKEVDMGSLGTHTLRIANTTTPDECSTTGFSQTACGFVLEFTDIITIKQMNSSTTNVNGWSASSMRTYVNSNIYNALPEVLKNAIVDTTVVSGHGTTEGENNFVTSDKIYLLSAHEVWEDIDGNINSGINYYDTSYDNTRQLDYYKKIGVTSSNYSGAIKKLDNTDYYWWLRSAYFNGTTKFRIVNSYGNWNDNYDSNYAYGVSPAFRLG